MIINILLTIIFGCDLDNPGHERCHIGNQAIGRAISPIATISSSIQ